jgi:hypothetical protein
LYEPVLHNQLAMLAFVDLRIPQLFDVKNELLFSVFCIMAFFISPISPLDERKKETTAICWLFVRHYFRVGVWQIIMFG